MKPSLQANGTPTYFLRQMLLMSIGLLLFQWWVQEPGRVMVHIPWAFWGPWIGAGCSLWILWLHGPNAPVIQDEEAYLELRLWEVWPSITSPSARFGPRFLHALFTQPLCRICQAFDLDSGLETLVLCCKVFFFFFGLLPFPLLLLFLLSW